MVFTQPPAFDVLYLDDVLHNLPRWVFSRYTKCLAVLKYRERLKIQGPCLVWPEFEGQG